MTDLRPTELSPDAENLIAQATGGDEPSAFDEKRVRTRLAARLAAAAIATSTASTTPAQALSASTVPTGAVTSGISAASAGSIGAALKTGAAGAMGSALSKILLAFALGGGSAALGAHYVMDEPTRDARAQESTASGNHFTESPAASFPTPEGEIAAQKREPSSVPTGTERGSNQGPSARRAETPAATSQAAPTQTAQSPVLRRKAASANSVSTSNSALADEASLSSSSTVRQEAALLRRARSALASGAGAEAQMLLRQHKELFPQGALVEERTATQVMAECAQGRTARTDGRAAEFLRAYPRSPLASSVRQACSPSEQQNDLLTDLPSAGH